MQRFFLIITLNYLLTSRCVYSEFLKPREVQIGGYDCGHYFFTDEMITEALGVASRKLIRNPKLFETDKKLPYPSGSDFGKWPLHFNNDKFSAENSRKSTYNLVIDQNFRLIDVVAKTSDKNYHKCIRKDRNMSGSQSSITEETNGYQCSDNFFSDERLEESAVLARKKLHSNEDYPAPYTGPLFGSDLAYKIWPLLTRGKIYKSGSTNLSPYFIVIGEDGKLKDVIVKASNGTFLKCPRIRKIMPAPSTDPYTKLFVQPPKPGYKCNKIFFSQKYVQDSIDQAKKVSKSKRGDSFPLLYEGPEFPQSYYIWPLKKDEKIYIGGNTGYFRVVMNQNFEFVNVIIQNVEGVKICHETNLMGRLNHDIHDYMCGDRYYPNSKLISETEKACSKMGENYAYPKIYDRYKFNIIGPYYVYPIFTYKSFSKGVGPDLLVMNNRCELAGAITTLYYGVKNTAVKCTLLMPNSETRTKK